MQGLMLLRTNECGRLGGQYREPLVYIDNLASAFWNLPNVTESPRFRGVGYILFGAAVSLSIDKGWEGRVGLHSLPGAEDFYGDVDKCGMTDMQIDASHQDLRYFEMSAMQAKAFIKKLKE